MFWLARRLRSIGSYAGCAKNITLSRCV
jgi:hypothetical protein